DFTRVIDEGKNIRLGAPIKAGDTITVRAGIARVEDFKTTYEGRRVVVTATAVNQRGEMVGEVISTMVSRIAVKVRSHETKVIYQNDRLATKFDLLEGKKTFETKWKKPELDGAGKPKKDEKGEKFTEIIIAKGGLVIPPNLADTYGRVDPNRIHLSDTSAIMAGWSKGRIMQGLGTLAYVNEQVVLQLQRTFNMRGVKGITDLSFSGIVLPGEALNWEIIRKAHAEGDHLYEIRVKKDSSVVLKYNLVMQGPKTAVLGTGQGSQHKGMGDDLVKDPENKAMLEVLQGWVPVGFDAKPMVDLFKELNLGTQDTDKAQPMIASYEIILFINAVWQGLIPDDAVFSGHSLGMWGSYFGALIRAAAKKFAAEGKTFKNKVEFLQAMTPILEPILRGVCMRGAVMGKYIDRKRPQGMIAVMAQGNAKGLTSEQMELLQTIVAPNVWVANDNSPTQQIIGGYLADLKEVTPVLEAWGYRVVPLRVPMAFHTPLAAQAADDFGVWVDANGNPFQIPEGFELYMDILGIPLSEAVANERARTGNPDLPAVEVLYQIMRSQIKSGVKWRENVRRMLADGVRRFVEFGPQAKREKGGTLLPFVKAEAEALGIFEKIEIVYANPFYAQDQWEVFAFNAEPSAPAEFSKPTVIPGKPRAASAQPLTQAATPSAATSAIAPAAISAAQVKAVVAGADGTSVEKLAAQLASLGAGAYAPLSARLNELAGAGATASGGGASLEQKLFDILKGFGVTKMPTTTSSLKDDLGIDSNNIGEVRSAIQPALSIEIPDSDLEGITTFGHLADLCKKKGATGGGASGAKPAALSKADLFEKAAIEKALATMSPPTSITVSIAPVSIDQVQAARQGFFQQNPADAAKIAELAAKLAESYQALGAGALAHLEQRLANLSGGVSGSSGGGASIDKTVFDVLKGFNVSKMPSATASLKDDLGIDSNNIGEVRSALQAALAIEIPDSDLEGITTFGHLVDLCRKKGAKGGAASAAPSGAPLSVEDQVDKAAIEKVLPALRAMAQPSGGGFRAVAIAAVSADQVKQALASVWGSEAARNAVYSQAPGAAYDQALEKLKEAYLALGPGAIPELQKRLEEMAKEAAGRKKVTLQKLGVERFEREGIAKALPLLYAKWVEATTGADAAKAIQGYVAFHTVGLIAAPAKATPASGERLVLQEDGSTLADPTFIQLERLQAILDNVIKGTSSFFVYQLMQPHFDPSKIYSFEHVEENGGRTNLMYFIGDVYSKRLNAKSKDLEQRINQTANQMDEVSLSWLKTFITKAKEARLSKEVVLLKRLCALAEALLKEGKIATGRVVQIRTGNHVPEYGSPQKVNFVPRDAATADLAKELTKPGLADPKTKADLTYLLEEGYDLRGVKVVVQEAGTMTYPLIAKLLQMGADVVLTNYAGRSRMREDGQSQNDFFFFLENENAARGGRLTVLPNLQPGNPHDEDALLAYFTAALDDLKKFDKIHENPKQAFARQQEIVAMLPLNDFGMKIRQKLKEVEAERAKDPSSTKLLELSSDERKAAMRLIVPQMYINGAAKEDYGPLQGRGDPHSVLAVMVLASRHIAISLAEMHKKYETGNRLAFLNYTSPNDESNLGNIDEGELVPSVLPFSRNYTLAKAALSAGGTAATAFANGIVDKEGNAILVEVSARTGWGKSNGDHKTIMSGNDFFTEAIEEAAREEGIELLTLTGDQLATLQLSALLALHSKRRSGEHYDYDFTYGFLKAAARGLLQKLFIDTKKTEEAKHQEAKEAWEKKRAEEIKADPSFLPNDGSMIDLNNINIAIKDASVGHVYAARRGDFLIEEDYLPAVVGYGMVGPLGPDALTNYRAMLAAGNFRGHEGYEWLGEYDFFNLARSMGVDVAGWDSEKIAASLGVNVVIPEGTEPTHKRKLVEAELLNWLFKDGDGQVRKSAGWENAFEDWLGKNSGLQQIDDFVEFEMFRDVRFEEDTAIPVLDPAMGQKMALAGYEFTKDGKAVARAGRTYKLPVKYRLPATVVGA
ncbi:MAG: phosphopantetheine-binding protein, partial [Deltaproteobacteria bacterium]|nr:phosphopantetheine-binding protein [Deltaproteobacteria bacterium]